MLLAVVCNLRPFLRIPNETGERMQVGCGWAQVSKHSTALLALTQQLQAERGGAGVLSPGVEMQGSPGLLDLQSLVLDEGLASLVRVNYIVLVP